MDELERVWRVRVGARYVEVALLVLAMIVLLTLNALTVRGPWMFMVAIVGLVLFGGCMVVFTVILARRDASKTRSYLRRTYGRNDLSG